MGEAQNAVTFPYLERIPNREALRARVMELNDYERYGAPARKGPYFFFSKNDGLQNQTVWYIQGGPTARRKCCSIRTRWSADGTVHSRRSSRRKTRIRRLRHLAERLRLAGVQVLELATKRTLEDNVEWVKVSQVAWKGDGFFYSRYPEPPEGHEKASINEDHQVFFHKLGTPQGDDTLVYRGPGEPAALSHARPRRTTNAS